MVSYEHKVKNIYLGSPYNEGTPIIPGDYTLLRGPCDEGFHVPLQAERQAIKDAGVTVSQFKIKLHIPFAGSRNRDDATWNNDGSSAYLWSSSPDGDNVRAFRFNSSSVVANQSAHRTYGFSVRGFRNTPIIPDSSWTETVTGKVWYNSTLGLISILVGTNQYVTIQDKNVGTTVVWNDGDTLTNDNRGKYYQRGNNYGFTRGSTGDASSIKVNASDYGPSNPYSSSTFITASSSPYDRSSVKNDNLRGYTDFNS